MKNKDWTENYHSIYVTLGTSNHSQEEREANDYYATHPKAVELLLEQEKFCNEVWEPACGEGHISKVLENNGYKVHSSDLIYRGYGNLGSVDFLKFETDKELKIDIISNPPYSYAKDFVEKSLDLIQNGCKVAMFLKLQFLEGKSRKELFKKYPPKVVYVSSARLLCAKNGEFEKYPSSAVAYAWFVWEKGFTGDPVIKWI